MCACVSLPRTHVTSARMHTHARRRTRPNQHVDTERRRQRRKRRDADARAGTDTGAYEQPQSQTHAQVQTQVRRCRRRHRCRNASARHRRRQADRLSLQTARSNEQSSTLLSAADAGRQLSPTPQPTGQSDCWAGAAQGWGTRVVLDIDVSHNYTST